MKTLLKITLGLMLSSVAFISCDDDDDNNDSTVAERLQHTWLVDSISLRTVTTTTDNTVTEPGTGSDYFDFRSDGKLYSKIGANEPDTVSYSILDNTRIVVDGDTGTIEMLTNNRFIGSARNQLNTTDYTIVRSYLRR